MPSMDLTSIRTNRNIWLMLCFLTYVGLLFVYGEVYYRVFNSNPQAFSFNSDILRSQALGFKASTEQELTTLHLKLDALREFETQISERIKPPTMEGGYLSQVSFELPNYVFVFAFSGPRLLDQPYQQEFVHLTVTDRKAHLVDNEIVALSSGPLSTDPMKMYRDFATAAIRTTETAISEDERRLGTIGGLAPEVWSFWDFFYFSVISQTTVGYGDILPNSTRVRMVVVSQIVIGLGIVTVAINLIFKGRRRLGKTN